MKELILNGDKYNMTRIEGGEAPHFGLVLTEGGIDCCSVERDFNKQSARPRRI